MSDTAEIRRFLSALVRIALAPDAAEAADWRRQAEAAHGRIGATISPEVHLVGLWDLAVKEAERDPAVRRQETVNPMLPTRCPVGVDDLFKAEIDLDRLVEAIRCNASFG